MPPSDPLHQHLRPVPLYVVAPYADPEPRVIRWNIARAALLGRYALTQHLAPIVVHVAIPALLELVDTPASRAVGLEWAKAQLRLVAGHTGGKCWVLEPDNGILSPGMREELAEWKRVRSEPRNVVQGRWVVWGPAMSANGLGALHRQLIGPPPDRTDPLLRSVCTCPEPAIHLGFCVSCGLEVR